MVCFNVLELLLDETAMPRGMEVRDLPKTFFILSVYQSLIRLHWCFFPLCCRTLTSGWHPSPCSVHWAPQFKSFLFCILSATSPFVWVFVSCWVRHGLWFQTEIQQIWDGDKCVCNCFSETDDDFFFFFQYHPSNIVLMINFSYLMVSSVVGFYSSPLFTGLLPRAQDTNLTQVPSSLTLHVFLLTVGHRY